MYIRELVLAQWPNQHNEPLHWGIIKMCTCITAGHSVPRHSRQFRSHNPLLAVMSDCTVRQVGLAEGGGCHQRMIWPWHDHFIGWEGEEQRKLKLEILFWRLFTSIKLGSWIFTDANTQELWDVAQGENKEQFILCNIGEKHLPYLARS